MDRFKKTLGIISTNWIHIIGFYITAYLSGILFKLIGIEESSSEGWDRILLYGILTIPVAFLIYGSLIIISFYGVIVLLDAIAFNLTEKYTKRILIIEWIIIIPPFINWAFEYKYWFWLTLS